MDDLFAGAKPRHEDENLDLNKQRHVRAHQTRFSKTDERGVADAE